VDIKDHGDGRFSVRALTPIDDFNEALGTQFGDEEFDTIGGLLMQYIGHMPKNGETAVIDGCQFRVLAADSRRLHLLQVTLDPVE
ncbi:MAG: magnesium and cobalt transporter, partial [Granulosicoccus sp.]